MDFKAYFENSIGPWLGKTVKIVDYHLHEMLKDEGIDVSKEQMIILMKLHEKDGLTQNELAIKTFRDKSSLARLLSKMERKGYILRQQSKEDKRINEVFMTALGKTTFEKTRPLIKNIIDMMQNGISESERQFMIKILQKVQGNLTSQTTLL